MKNAPTSQILLKDRSTEKVLGVLNAGPGEDPDHFIFTSHAYCARARLSVISQHPGRLRGQEDWYVERQGGGSSGAEIWPKLIKVLGWMLRLSIFGKILKDDPQDLGGHPLWTLDKIFMEDWTGELPSGLKSFYTRAKDESPKAFQDRVKMQIFKSGRVWDGESDVDETSTVWFLGPVNDGEAG